MTDSTGIHPQKLANVSYYTHKSNIRKLWEKVMKNNEIVEFGNFQHIYYTLVITLIDKNNNAFFLKN